MATVVETAAGPSSSNTAPTEPANKHSEGFEVLVEFGGGLAALFDNQDTLRLVLPPPYTLRHLISLLRPLASSPEMFASPGPRWDLRPGVLAVVGGEDWEVREPGGMECQVEKGEEVVFISTLHGG